MNIENEHCALHTSPSINMGQSCAPSDNRVGLSKYIRVATIS